MTTSPDTSDMTPEELAIAADFEKGWSEERLDAAEFSWGPGLVDVLPHVLAKKSPSKPNETASATSRSSKPPCSSTSTNPLLS